MATTVKRYAGQVTNSKADILSAVTNAHIIHSMLFHNVDGSSRTLTLWLNDGTSRQMISVSINPDETYSYDFKFNMESGDAIEAQASVSSAINFWLSGVEIT